MKLFFSLPAWLVAFAFAFTASAGNLDAPATKPVTVRSEIARGYSAALSAAASSESSDKDLDAFLAVSTRNEQAQTDTDAFLLGLCYGEWKTFWSTLNRGAAFIGTGADRTDNSDLIAQFAAGAHQGFRDRAKKLGLTDDQLKEAFGSSYDPAQDEPAFDKALKTRQFKGSMPKR